MLWVIEISKIFEKKTENTNKTEKIYKNVRIILRLHAKQDKIYCIQENNRGYIMEKYMKQLMQNKLRTGCAGQAFRWLP